MYTTNLWKITRDPNQDHHNIPLKLKKTEVSKSNAQRQARQGRSGCRFFHGRTPVHDTHTHTEGKNGTWDMGLRLRLRHDALRLERTTTTLKGEYRYHACDSGWPAAARAACGASARPGGERDRFGAAEAENRASTRAQKTQETGRTTPGVSPRSSRLPERPQSL